jgi:ABC-type multidrug transport system permease subunit
LSDKLTPEDYSSMLLIINLIENDINEMRSLIHQIEVSNANLLTSNFNLIVGEIESIRDTLYKIDSDLDYSINKTVESQNRVSDFILRLDSASEEIQIFQDNMDLNKITFEFKNSRVIPDDPILVAFPLLVTIIITFTSLVLPNIFVLKQINSPSYMRELFSPVRDWIFLSAEYLVNLFFILIQVLVLFLLGFYWFDIPVSSLQTFVIWTLITASIFIFLGMSFAYLIRSQSLSMLITIFFVMILFIFSDLLVPINLGGTAVKILVNLNPFVILKTILQDILVFKEQINFITGIGVWVSFSFLISLMILIVSRKINRGKAE